MSEARVPTGVIFQPKLSGTKVYTDLGGEAGECRAETQRAGSFPMAGQMFA